MYEIFSYGNNDALFGIFNAIAAIMGSRNYLGALGAVAVIGFMVAGLAYAFAPEKLIGWKWLGSVVVVYSILFVPKVTVSVVDKLGTQPVQVVSNVPFGAAVFGHLTSVIGNSLTELFEAAFQFIPGPGQLPSDLTYQKHGLLFGNRLIRETRSMVFADPSFRTDMINFIHNCTMYDLSDGTINPAAFSRSTDLWTLMGTSPNPARYSTVAVAGKVVPQPCPQAYLNLSNRMPAQVADLNNSLAVLVNPNLPVAEAQAELGNQVWSAYVKTNLAGAASSAADLIRQNAVINSVKDTSLIIGQKLNDPSSLILAMGRAQAMAQINASWINFGHVAQEALPLIRNSLEGITYALFPFVILLLFFTYGQGTVMALKSYLVALIWIQLWPPVYAILNYFATLASAKSIAAAAHMPSGTGMSLLTASPVYQNSISAEAVVGYLLMVALPAVAWSVVKGVDTIGQSNITGVGSLQSALTGSTGSAAAGNLSSGNVSMDQVRTTPTRSSAYARMWQDELSNNTFNDNILSGKRTVSLAQNEGYVSMTSSRGFGTAVEERLSKGIETTKVQLEAASRQKSAALAESVSKGREHLDTSQLGSAYTSAESAAAQQNYGDVKSMVQRYARTIGKDEGTAAYLLFDAAGNIGGGIGGGGKGGQGAGVDVSAGGALTQRYSSGLQRNYEEAAQNMTSEQSAKLNEYARRFQSDEQFRTAVIGSGKDSEELVSRLQTSVSREKRAEETLRELTSFAEEARYAETRDERASIDMMRDPANWKRMLEAVARHDGSPQAQQTVINNMLLEYGALTRPQRNLKGANLPWGHEAVNEQHQRNLAEKGLQSGVDDTYKKMKSKVGANPTSSIDSGGLSDNVNSEISRQRSGADAALNSQSGAMNQAGKNFDTVTGIVKTTPGVDSKGVGNPDGVLRSKRILGNDARDLFAEDVKQSFDNAVDGAKELGDKAKDAVDRALGKKK
ncbi:conjugal transfer protein TraG N-terminal domain-containing protein [Actimicrobium sp. CCI2.3]|uniref:conjugal transfer protein TraG N-terminal domain-containing protein n=1 Tax=Actimicrobium sp. CCI2.3 TaxID=3048616 RepID=UPI002AB54B86|nr:conjugal transfer protein TraG N-terminal domain-containing protein [Actimicrobium sp. CCI2.3]MDY7574452.1 conjugal transfer protein TraG N-terminal domain-containing protein [Actimicrobium sp. CCI2.3]MEB0022470.1 conjugal transfer protein TraG N-terminal domain-containing protein [Actimicrobium sp. CCI2.3]